MSSYQKTPKIAIQNKRFFREIEYSHSVPIEEADAILFPWRLKDTMVLSAPDTMLKPLRKIFKEKKPNWKTEFNVLLNELGVQVIRKLLNQFRKRNNHQRSPPGPGIVRGCCQVRK